MVLVARWKGDRRDDDNVRGYWRVFCPVCSERLGTLRPIDRTASNNLVTLDLDTYLAGCAERRPTQPLPYREAWVVIAPPRSDQEYRRRRDGSYVIREQAAIAELNNVSNMTRGGTNRPAQLAAAIAVLQTAKREGRLTSAEVRARTIQFARDPTNIRAVAGARELAPGNIIGCPRISCRRNVQLGFPDELTLALMEDIYLVVLRRNDPILRADQDAAPTGT